MHLWRHRLAECLQTPFDVAKVNTTGCLVLCCLTLPLLQLHLGLTLVIQSCLLLLLVLLTLLLLCWQCIIQLYMCGAEDGRFRRHTGTHAEGA